MRVLHLILKSEYWHQIEAGTKQVEFRRVNNFWCKRLIDRSYDKIIFQLGYSKKNRLIADYLGYQIVVKNIPLFGNDSIPVFAIKFENIKKES